MTLQEQKQIIKQVFKKTYGKENGYSLVYLGGCEKIIHSGWIIALEKEFELVVNFNASENSIYVSTLYRASYNYELNLWYQFANEVKDMLRSKVDNE